MPSTIDSLIGFPWHNVFRRAYIKRRNTADGKYESSWTEITKYIKSWGSFQGSVDAVRLNKFTHSGLTLRARNDTGAFNPETDTNSLWFNTLSRYRTLIRIDAGYENEDGTELPTSSTQGIYIMSEELPRSSKTNDVILSCRSLISIFDEVTADEVAGLGVTQAASDIIARIRDYTDGAGNFVFREFITSTSWTIQTTTSNYNLATTTSELENMTCYELMTKLAECEGFVFLINRSGGVEFRDRNPRTTTAAFSFYGQGFRWQNVISLDQSFDALDKYYNKFRLKWTDADTSTSYVEAGTITTVDPSNTAWKFGSRMYNFSNEFFNTSTAAQSIVNSLLTTFNEVKEEIKITAFFIPHVELLDRITFSYHSYSLADQNNSLWDIMNWASDAAANPGDGGEWALENGENFDYNDKAYKILSKSTNLDNFTTIFTLREI